MRAKSKKQAGGRNLDIVVKVMIIIIVVLAAILIALYFLGKRADKKQAESQKQMEAVSQRMTMLIIDKKKMRITQSGLPEIVIKETPWYLKRSKVPIVKAKVGPRVVTLMCDSKIFDQVPTKKEVKATVSGIYITAVQGIRGPLEKQTKPKKKGLLSRLSGR